MNKKITIETRLILSKKFPPGTGSVSAGRYTIRPIPSTRPNEAEAMLEFIDSYESPLGEGGGSNPEEEANIVCNLLSLVLETRLRRNGLRLNAFEIPTVEGAIYARFRGNLNVTNLDETLQHALHLPINLARQLSRSCRAYSSALDFIPGDPTFAFFLLVVAVECLSSQAAIIPPAELDLDSKKCERFCTFIDRYLPDDARSDDERDQGLFRELLKTVYYSHRSGFVHGGKEVSRAAVMADVVKSSYFKHATEGQEVKTPGLDWFAHIVRGSILGYLGVIPIESATLNENLLAELAFEKAALRIKAKTNLKAGQPVMSSDIEYR